MLWFILCYVNFVYSISNVLFLNDFDYKNRKFLVTKTFFPFFPQELFIFAVGFQL